MRRSTATRLHRFLVCTVVVAVVLTGCRADSLSEEEEQQIHDILLSGLEMQDDEYVRAETLRAIDITGDAVVARLGEELIGDSHPVVRISALRTLLRSAELETPYNTALRVYNTAQTDAERYQVLDIVLTEGDDRTRRTILERAYREDAPRIRQRALEGGLVRDIEQAVEEGDEQNLEHELLPELGNYVDDDDPEVAATALRALLDNGREGRAQRFVRHFTDEGRSIEERLHAGQILLYARAEAAEDAFRRMVTVAEADERDALGRPEQDIDEELIRIAVLGLATLGDADYVEPAKEYLVDAPRAEAIEILKALAPNPDEEAAIALRSDIRSAREDVRRTALSLYGQRDDARSDVLFRALRNNDFETRRLAIAALTERFPDEWTEYLADNLDSPDPNRVEHALQMIEQVLTTGEDIEPLLDLGERLEEIATDDQQPEMDTDDERKALQYDYITNRAAFAVFRITDDDAMFREVLEQKPAPRVRAAYLEHLATHDPGEHADVLREHLFDDLYFMRLIAAVGLWSAFSDGATWPGEPEHEQEDDEDEEQQES